MTGSADQSGARRTPPPGGDPDVWARRLRRILDEQISLYEQLEALSKLQSRAIAEEDADQLLTILGQREAIIGELMRLNEDLSPFVENWADLSVRLPVQQRDALSGAFDRVGELVRAIGDRDELDKRELESRRSKVKASMANVSKGRGAVAAYTHPDAPGRARYQDREG